jgi:hypothetical protein
MNISRIEKIVEKHSIFLSEYFNKNNFSFCFISRTENPYFCVSVKTEESYGGSCWNEEIYFSEYEFKKSKVINSLRFFLSILIPKATKSNLQKIAQEIYKEIKPEKRFEDSYYGNYTKKLVFKVPLEIFFKYLNS